MQWETNLIRLTKILRAALKLHSWNTEVEVKFVSSNNGMKTNEENHFLRSALPLLFTSMLLVRTYLKKTLYRIHWQTCALPYTAMLWFFVYNLWKSCFQFRSRRWGSSLPGLRTLDPPLAPPLTWAKNFRCTCLKSHLKTSPPTTQKSYPKCWKPRTTFENAPLCPPKYSIVRG